ncbi:LysR family transcriptional regulator [Deltaproteobacteria bacterium]|nr:LysR family transcriptional regulator [Deltaproteobacteria bacterium]
MPPPVRYTLDQLLVLESIATTGSFAAAARDLHRVPSAISYTVQGLETALGVALFDRSGHRAGLTSAGRQVLEEARDLMARARKLDQLATLLGDGWEPELQVVVDGAYPMAPLLAALHRFIDEKIPTQVRMDVEYQDGVIDRFHEAHADFMIALGIEDGGRLKGVPLAPLEMVLVVGAAHPLARLRNLSRDALADHVDLVVRDSSPSFAHTPRKTFLGTRHVVRFSDFHSKLAALLSGVGFGWMPEHLVTAAMAEGRLVLVDLPAGNRWSYTPQLITRRDELPGRAATLFMSLLRADGQE